MKKGQHPDYKPLTVTCVCGNTIETGSVKNGLRVEICNACHPFYAGTQKIVDTEGRVDKFKNRYKDVPTTAAKSAKKLKIEQKLKEEAEKQAAEEAKEKAKREAIKKAKAEAKEKAKAKALQAEEQRKQQEAAKAEEKVEATAEVESTTEAKSEEAVS